MKMKLKWKKERPFAECSVTGNICYDILSFTISYYVYVRKKSKRRLKNI